MVDLLFNEQEFKNLMEGDNFNACVVTSHLASVRGYLIAMYNLCRTPKLLQLQPLQQICNTLLK